jgi:hypothetical protein
VAFLSYPKHCYPTDLSWNGKNSTVLFSSSVVRRKSDKNAKNSFNLSEKPVEKLEYSGMFD